MLNNYDPNKPKAKASDFQLDLSWINKVAGQVSQLSDNKVEHALYSSLNSKLVLYFSNKEITEEMIECVGHWVSKYIKNTLVFVTPKDNTLEVLLRKPFSSNN